MVREQVNARELLAALVRRDLSLRYKQSVLGVGWAVLAPLLQMLVFTVVFTRVVPLRTEVPYPLYAYAGLLPWTLFASAVRFGAGSLSGNLSLVTKVWFPREVLPVASVIVALVDTLVAGTVLVGLMAWYGVPLRATVLALPIIIAVQLAFTTAVALLVAMANLFWRDVKYLVELGLTVWMLGTSVVYPVDRVGGRIGDILALNPMTPIVESWRSVLLRGELPGAPFAAAAVASLLSLLVAWTLFHRAEIQFAERA